MGNRFANRLMMGNTDSKIRPVEDCYGHGLYDYSLGLRGAAGWVFGPSMRGHHLMDRYEKETYLGTKTARTLILMERTTTLRVYTFFFLLSNITHLEKLFSFCVTGGRKGPTYFSSLLF